MAIEIKQKKEGNFLPILIIILVLVIGGWFFYNLIRKTEFIQPKIEEILSPTSQELINTQLDINKILNNQIFLSLVPHINWPLPLPPQLGKDNPFSPF
jgi:hypothetical protein